MELEPQIRRATFPSTAVQIEKEVKMLEQSISNQTDSDFCELTEALKICGLNWKEMLEYYDLKPEMFAGSENSILERLKKILKSVGLNIDHLLEDYREIMAS